MPLIQFPQLSTMQEHIPTDSHTLITCTTVVSLLFMLKSSAIFFLALIFTLLLIGLIVCSGRPSCRLCSVVALDRRPQRTSLWRPEPNSGARVAPSSSATPPATRPTPASPSRSTSRCSHRGKYSMWCGTILIRHGE